jgi:hypothetical protein
VLHCTWAYHLWHPPSASRPREWKHGNNVAYLQRLIRLTRCLNGYLRRTSGDLTVRLADELDTNPALGQLVARHGWIIECDSRVRTDLELAWLPGRARFSGRGDCRILAILDGSLAERTNMQQAHIVLSPLGDSGWPQQLKLRLDDTGGLWSALENRPLPIHRAAA